MFFIAALTANGEGRNYSNEEIKTTFYHDGNLVQLGVAGFPSETLAQKTRTLS